MPMSRGILESIYVKIAHSQVTINEVKKLWQQRYEHEPFVHVLDGNILPQTRHVRGSNHCFMNVVQDRISNRLIIISAIDNLVKGASGQALQNMNILFGFEETLGLNQAPMFP
jgi:N-acetyl-gamma-glutamyl-phosphate reductase